VLTPMCRLRRRFAHVRLRHAARLHRDLPQL